MASNNPNPLGLVYLVDELGELGRLPSGAVVNIGGVSGDKFTVGGKQVMLDGGNIPGGGEAIVELTEKLNSHLDDNGVKHAAYQISVDTTDLEPITGENVQQAIESISQSLKNGIANVELTGDVTGVSEEGIVETTLSKTGVIAGTYKSVTVDLKGRVLDGSNPTTLEEYGITDALNSTTGGSVGGSVTLSAGATVKGVPLPDEDSDVANKIYVDQQIGNAINGVSWRQAVQVATTTNISLNGLQTIDGQALEVDQRVLVKNQTDSKQNGIYIVSAGAWVRAADVDTGIEMLNAAVLVLKGASQGLTQWVNTNSGEITIDQTAITFSQLQGATTAYTPGAGLSLSGTKFSITASGVVPGTYTKVTVNNLGQVITGSNFNAADLTSILGYTPYNGTANPNGFLTSVNLTASDLTTILGYTPYNGTTNTRGFLTSVPNTTYTGDVTGSGQGSVTLSLANTGITPGTYAKVTVDGKGRVTAGGNLSDAEIVAAIGYTPYNGTTNPNGYISNTVQITLSGDVIGQGFPSIASSLSATGVVPGTYSKVTVDSKGRVSAGAQLTNAEISSAIGYTPYNGTANPLGFITTIPNTTYTGDVTGTGKGSVALTLGTTGVTPGIYTKVTVDAKGRVTLGDQLTNTEISNAIGYTPYNGTTNTRGFLTSIPNTTYTGDVTGSGQGSVAMTLATTGVTAGTYSKVTVDNKGRVTAGSTLSSSEINSAIGYTPVNKAGDTMAGALNFAGPFSVSSASVSTVAGLASNNVNIIGAGTITTFGTIAAGAIRNIRFGVAATLMHNASTFVLPGAANIVTAIGDYAQFVSLGDGAWKCDVYQRASGEALVATAKASPFTTTQVFNGSASQMAMRVKNISEINKLVGAAPAVTQNFYVSEGSVQMFSAATSGWTLSVRFDSTTTLGSALQLGDSVTIVTIVPQGTSGYVPVALQIDGATTTVNWQNKQQPEPHPSSIDVFSYVIIKTAASAYTVLASQTQYGA